MARERYAWICESKGCAYPHRVFIQVGDPRPRCKSCGKPMAHQVNNLYFGTRPGSHRADAQAG